MKKIALLFTIMSLSIVASAAVNVDGINYNLDADKGIAEVSRNLLCQNDVIIPETITYEDVVYTVTSIAASAFHGNSSITSVTIPNSVTIINERAFMNCSGMTSVVIPERVTTINNGVFSGCSSLMSLTIPNSVTCIDDGAFSGCKSLTSVTIPESVASIGSYCFSGCNALESITLPNSITSISDGVFYDCTSLTSVTIPTNVMSIGDKAFGACTSLISFTIPNHVTSIGSQAFSGCTNLKSITIPNSVTTIGIGTFDMCWNLTDIIFPNMVTTIEGNLFSNCYSLTSFTIPNSVTTIGVWAFSACENLISLSIGSEVKEIGGMAFSYCTKLSDVFCYAEEVPNTSLSAFEKSNIGDATLHVPAASLQIYKETAPWRDFKYIVPLETEVAYRPMIEDDKVWKVGNTQTISDNSVNVVDYYYFDGDTIIDGKACKEMMRQRFVSPDYSDDYWTPEPSLSYVGAWYEENKKVYFYDENKQSMVIMYDFSLNDNESMALIDGYPPFIIGPKQTGGIEGFKGVYRNVMINQDIRSTTWLEGVGGIDGPTRNAYPEAADPVPEFLMSCAVGDEVIYLNDEYEDGATPEGARKSRFDFTHTIKTKPQAPRRSKEELSIYGEYNDLQLGINLNPLYDAYLVRITNESGQIFYEKTINAGSIVALSIDISAYAKGRYTVTVENSSEYFTGEFEVQTAGIEENVEIKELKNVSIYNLQGQRISSLQKGLNIVNGQKIYVK